MGGLQIRSLFLLVLNMSISASWLILVVMVLRWIFQKVNVPKKFCYVLWFFVAVRLLCPISLESAWSLLPSGQTFSEKFLYEANPKISSGISFIDKVVNDFLVQVYISGETGDGSATSENSVGSGNNNAFIQNEIGTGNSDTVSENIMGSGNSNASAQNGIGTGNSDTVLENIVGSGNSNAATQNGAGTGNSDTFAEDIMGSENSNEFTEDIIRSGNTAADILYMLSILWGAGVAGMVFYSIMSYCKLKKTVDVSIHLRENLWICDEIQSPFILGMCQPRIYLPSHIAKEQVPYIIAHEAEHLKYRDHWWKPLGFGILAVHWFNPVVWIAYVCMCRDIELACDERVICRMNNAEKKKYTESLLLCSSPRHLISACPVAFGEIGIKERIKSVITYKKPAAWLVGATVMLCIVVAVCFLTNPTPKITFETWTSSITSDDISWVKVLKNYEKETMSGQISKEEYEELCEVLGTIANEDCFVEDEIGDFLDKYTLVLSRMNQTWKFFCLEDGMVGVEFADNETALDFGCGGQFMVIESEALWDYIVNVAEVHRVTELTPTMAFGYLFGDTLTKMMVNSHYYDTECACAITKNNRVVAHLSSYFQNYEWERVEKPFISSTDEWVRFESTADATELIFWNEGEGIIECRLPNYGEGSPIYWQAKPKENVEMSNSFFTNAWKLCLDECIMNGYMKNHNAESLTKLIGLMNLEELFADYDGNTICHHFVDNTVGTMQRDDIVYYRTEETDMQKIVQTMFSVMLDALLEPSENRPYTVTQYRLDEMEIIQGSENIWFIPFVKGAYKYDGVDLVTFEEQLPYTTVYEDGLIPLFGQGSDSMFYYILIRNEGVYRLERGGKFASKYDYLLNMEKLEETAEYTESVKFETEADLNQDGLVDKIALVMYKANEAGDFGELIANLRNTSNYVRVKAYYGIGYNDFSKEPFYISEKFGMHAENKGTIGLTTWNGKDYLFTAHMNEAGEEADYSYTLFNFENGEETIAVFDQVQFSMKDNPYAWVEDGLEFHTNFSQQVCEGIILAGFDADEIVTAQSGVQTDASTYFNCIWNCGSVTPSRLMKEQLRKLGLEKEIVLSEKAEFIAQVDAQMADYFKKRETSYYTNDSLTERGRALDAWEKRLRFRIEDAQIGYCYGSLYDVSERERVVYVSEVGFMDCYYLNEEAYEKHFINTEHLFTFELKNGQWKLVSDAYAETHLGYQQGLGLADWEVYLYGVFGGELDLENLYTLRNMDLHVWFEEYNGEEIQCIRGAESDSPAIRGDIVYYYTKENDAQAVLKRMIEEMVNPLMIASEERPYTITKYRIDDSRMYQVNENIWYVTYLNGYYKYEGLDMAPFETRLQEEAADADGLVSFERQGSDTVFSYVLLKEGDVYCLRRFGSMDIGYEALNYEDFGME